MYRVSQNPLLYPAHLIILLICHANYHILSGSLLVGCWSLTSWKHLMSYQNGYHLLTVDIHGNLIVLPHWETKLPVHTQSWYPDNDPFPILIMLCARLGSDKNKYLSHWMYWTAKQTPGLSHVRPTLCRFGHRTQYFPTYPITSSYSIY